MIEAWMFLAIGFLIACLCWIAFVPLIHNRAVRLTVRRLDQTGPQSLAEVKADKDHLRAEHAIAVSRLETQLLLMQTDSTNQRAELGRKHAAIETLKATLDEQTGRGRELEQRIESYQDRIAVLEQQLAEQTDIAARRGAELASHAARIGKLSGQELSAESARVEIAALMTQVDALKTQIDDANRAKTDADNIVAAQRLLLDDLQAKIALEQSSKAGELAEARTRIGDLEAIVGRLSATQATDPGIDSPLTLVKTGETERPKSTLAVN